MLFLLSKMTSRVCGNRCIGEIYILWEFFYEWKMISNRKRINEKYILDEVYICAYQSIIN